MTQEQGQLVEHIGHDECGSSDALAVYERADGSHNGYCWSCEAWVADPYGEQDGQPKGKKQFGGLGKIMTPQEKLARITEIYNTHQVRDLTDRGIRKDTAAYFDVRASVSGGDGVTPYEHYYPMYKGGQMVGYKIRRVEDKRFSQLLLETDVELFGQYQAAHTGAKKLFITEGECDAMAVFQVLRDLSKGTEYEHYMPAVVSIVRGASKEVAATKVVNELAAQRAFIDKFEEVVLIFDQDEQGKVSAEAVAKLWPEKVKIAKLPGKDANAMLKDGKLQELKRAIMWNADTYKPSGIKTVADLREKAREKAQWGESWPWPTLTRLSFGIRKGELIGVAAGVGVGKTSFWHSLEEHVIIGHKQKIGVFMLEEPNPKTLKMIAGKFRGKQFHNPEVAYDQAELDAAIDDLDGKILLYDHNEDRTWDTIKATIRHMVLVEGCKYIILDPISALTAHLDSSKTNDELNRMFGEVSAMAEALGFTLFYSSHLNAPETGAPHEEGGRVKLAQLTGSRAMIKWSHYIIGLERNTQAEDLVERNTVTCRVLKDREHGRTGAFPIVYNPETGEFAEPTVPTTGATY
jgi:twinkle protein